MRCFEVVEGNRERALEDARLIREEDGGVDESRTLHYLTWVAHFVTRHAFKVTISQL